VIGGAVPVGRLQLLAEPAKLVVAVLAVGVSTANASDTLEGYKGTGARR